MMKNLLNILIRAIKHFHNDSLYRNSIYLMMSTAVAALLGFIFWVIVTRMFDSEQVGLASTLLSSMMLISNFSLLGLNLGVIKYLPSSNNKSDQINTVITIVGITAFILSTGFILGLNFFSPKLLFIRENIIYISLFIFLTVFLSLDSVISNVFIAYRNTKYILYKNSVSSLIKIFLPFLLGGLGVFAIYLSASFGVVVGCLLIIYFLYKRFSYTFKLVIKKEIFLKLYKISFGNYIASFIASLPTMLLPLMITNNLGPKQAAFFYVDMMIINLLNVIQSSLNQALFAEGSNNSDKLKEHIIKAMKLIALLVIPLVLFIIVFGKYVLLVFGKEYSNEGLMLLNLLVLSSIFTSINGMLSAILNIKGKVNLLILMCIIGSIIMLSVSYYAIPKGLVSLGYFWLIGEGVITVIFTSILLINYKPHVFHNRIIR